MRSTLWLALALSGCARLEPPPGEAPLACEAPCQLLDHVDAFEGVGVVEHVPSWAERVQPEVVLRESLAEGALASLQGADRVQVVTGEDAWDGASVRVDGDGDSWGLLHSAPIPVDPERSYTISWAEAGRDIKNPRKSPPVPAGVSVAFYKVPRRHHDDPGAWLGAPDAATGDATDHAQAARVRSPRAARWRPAEGSFPWREVSHSFRPRHGATHAVVTVAAGRATSRRGSRFWLDDLELVGSVAAAWESRAANVWREPGAASLLRRARNQHPAHADGRDLRDALLAPAPSLLRTRVRVPAGGRLEVGFGLMPGTGSRLRRVRFRVTVVDEGGARHELLDRRARGSYRPLWQDESLDLARFAGRLVTLELETSGRATPEDPLAAVARQPESRAAWSDLRLVGAPERSRLAVFVLIDTLAAKHASGWGADAATTPELQRIGRDSRVFRRALAPSPWTLSSIASFLTGLKPGVHAAGEARGRDHWNRRRVSPAVETVAERLRDAGWDTRAWINNPFLAPRNSGLDQGFRRYVDYATRGSEHAAAPAIDAAIAELERGSSDDRLLFVHLLDPHGPYLPDDDAREAFVDPTYQGQFAGGLEDGVYQDVVRQKIELTDGDKAHLERLHHGVISWVDGQIGRLWDAARASGDELLFIATADHGEEFWEHGLFEHGHGLHDELIHVPLLVHQEGLGGVVDQAVPAVGVAGTLLDFAGLEHDLPRLPGPGESRAVHFGHNLYGLRQQGVEVDGWKYVLRHAWAGKAHRRAHDAAPRHRLHLLAEDPGESTNRVADQPERARALHERVVREALDGHPGAWFVLAQPDVPVTLRFTEARAGWRRDVFDFPWPGGREDEQLGVRRRQGAEELELTIAGGPVLILLNPAGEGDAVRLRSAPEVAGLPVDGMLPGGRTPPDALMARIAARIDSGLPFVEVGRLPGVPRGTAPAAAGPSDADLDALRALGYVE